MWVECEGQLCGWSERVIVVVLSVCQPCSDFGDYSQLIADLGMRFRIFHCDTFLILGCTCFA